MAIVLGTNSGFVETAPTTDPVGASTYISSCATVTKDTSPSTATKITEVGWWSTGGSSSQNYDIGLYASDGGSGTAGTLLYSTTQTVLNTTGWNVVTGLDWAILPNTDYWIGVQLDLDDSNPTADRVTSGGSGIQYSDTGYTALPADYTGLGTAVEHAAGMFAYYAVWSAPAGPANLKSYNTNLKANIKTINGNPIANVKSLNTNV